MSRNRTISVRRVRAQPRGARRCTPDLIELLRDPEEAVRFHVCTVLGAIGDGRALKALEALQQDPHESVRSNARSALKRLSTKK